MKKKIIIGVAIIACISSLIFVASIGESRVKIPREKTEEEIREEGLKEKMKY